MAPKRNSMLFLALLLLVHSSCGDESSDRHAHRLRHDKHGHTLEVEQADGRRTYSISDQVPSGGVVEVTHRSWLERMQGALWSVVVGIFLMWFSVPVMWINERRNARMESLIKLGERECTTISAASSNDDKGGSLVHVTEGMAHGAAPLQDNRFKSVKCDKGALMIRSHVEVYQWVEERHEKEEKDNVGGGTTKKISYTYSKTWSSQRNDSSAFHTSGYQNDFPVSGLELATQTRTCDLVELGLGYILPEDLVTQASKWETEGAPFHLGKDLAFNDKKFQKQGDYFYYSAKASYNSSPDDAQIGDTRVKIEFVPDHNVTVMAVQMAGDKRNSFLPYRMIERGCCGSMSKEEQRQLQIAEGQKSAGELASADMCDMGPLNCVCCCCLCACNIVTSFFSGATPPEVYHLFSGSLSASECWNRVKLGGMMYKWIGRLVGWLMLFVGTYMLFKPVEVMLDIIPFIGPYLGSFAGGAIYVLCLLVTFVVAAFIISAAYLVYHPLLGIFYLVILGGAIVGISYATAALKKGFS